MQTVKLAGETELRQQLAAVEFDRAVNKKRFITILVGYAGRKVSARGVVNMLQSAIVKYGPVKNLGYDPLFDKCQAIIWAIIPNEEMKQSALKELNGRAYM